MYRQLLVLSFVCLNLTNHLYPLLRYKGNVHEEQGMPNIHLFGDIHIKRHLETDFALLEREDEQINSVCSYFKNYKGTQPLHIFVEGSTYRMCFYWGVKLGGVTYLYDKLNPLAQNTSHIVDDFDIRKVTGFAISSFNTAKKEYDYPYKYRTDTPEGMQANFQALWNEIEVYLYTISYACNQYFGEKFKGSKAHSYLLKIQKKYRKLRTICDEYRIYPTELISHTACKIICEPLYYSEKKDLREKLFNTVLSIGSYLTDVALYLKVMQAHQQGKRVIVYAGNSHIRKLQKQLESYGLCAYSRWDGIVDNRSLSYAYDEDDRIGCPYSSDTKEANKCPYKREFPELPPMKYPYPPEESNFTRCILF